MVLPRREDYTNEALEAIERAHAWASDMRNAQLDAEHLALGMLSIKDGMANISQILGQIRLQQIQIEKTKKKHLINIMKFLQKKVNWRKN